MALADVAITLNINNNVSYPIDMNILGNPANLRDNANATTQYQYDVTGFTITNETNVVIQYKSNGSSSFSTFTQQLQSQNIQGVINALNLLGIGSFQTYTEFGSTYISTYNDSFTFGQLNIYANSIINPNFFYGSGFNNTTSALAYQSDGKILVGRNFTSYDGSTAIRFARINTDGSLDTTFVTGSGFIGGIPTTTAIQTDGKILVGGSFTSYNGTGANGIIRLNTDGSIDATFVYGTGFSIVDVNGIAIQTDGKILVIGGFTSYNGTGANRIIRLNTSGSIDGTFVYGTGFAGLPNVIAIQTDGKIVVAGQFASYQGTGANGIIRINTNGSIDGSFVYGTGFNNVVECIGIQNDGKIVLGGTFTTYNGSSSRGIIRLNTNGSKDLTFVVGTGFNSPDDPAALVIQGDGKIVLAGAFASYNGTTANNIIRINSNGSVDTTWNYGTGFDNIVLGLALQNSNLMVAGDFNSFNGTPANYIIQLLT